MGKIQLYQQGALASSNVGTPGIDNTGAILSEVGQDLGRLTQRYIAVEKAKIAISDDIEVEKHRVDFENRQYEQLEAAKQQNINNPSCVSDNAYNDGITLANDVAEGIENPRVKEKFLAKVQDSIRSGQNSARKWASEQTTANAFTNLVTASKGISGRGGTIKTPDELKGLLSSAEKLALSSVPVVGTEKAMKVYDDTKKELYQNFVYGHIEENPELVKKQVDSGMFDGVFNEKQRNEIKNNADAVIKKRQREIDLQNKSYFVDRVTDLYDKNLNDRLTLKEIDSEIATFKKSGADKGDIMSLLTIKKSLLDERESDAKHAAAEAKRLAKERNKPGKISYEDQASTLVNITDKYLNVFSKPGASGKVNSDVSLSELQSLQREIVSAASSKKLDKQTANSMLKNIVRGKQELMKTNKKVTTNEGGIFGIGKETKEIPIGIYNEGMKKINTWVGMNFKDIDTQKAVKHDALTFYVVHHDEGAKAAGGSAKFADYVVNKFRKAYGK